MVDHTILKLKQLLLIFATFIVYIRYITAFSHRGKNRIHLNCIAF